jgi:hypothetical protein
LDATIQHIIETAISASPEVVFTSQHIYKAILSSHGSPAEWRTVILVKPASQDHSSAMDIEDTISWDKLMPTIQWFAYHFQTNLTLKRSQNGVAALLNVVAKSLLEHLIKDSLIFLDAKTISVHHVLGALNLQPGPPAILGLEKIGYRKENGFTLGEANIRILKIC